MRVPRLSVTLLRTLAATVTSNELHMLISTLNQTLMPDLDYRTKLNQAGLVTYSQEFLKPCWTRHCENEILEPGQYGSCLTQSVNQSLFSAFPLAGFALVFGPKMFIIIIK
jgi:hypothetical protein